MNTLYTLTVGRRSWISTNLIEIIDFCEFVGGDRYRDIETGEVAFVFGGIIWTGH
jgi:hypothetical protein